MKKVLAISLISTLMICLSSMARTQYDSTGRYIIKDDTLRAQRNQSTKQVQKTQNAAQEVQAAPAAKIDYEQGFVESNLKANYPKNK